MPTGQPILTHPWDPTHSGLVVKGWGAEHTWNQPRGVKHLNQGSWGGSEKASTEPTVKDVLGSGARRTGEQSLEARQPLPYSVPRGTWPEQLQRVFWINWTRCPV